LKCSDLWHGPALKQENVKGLPLITRKVNRKFRGLFEFSIPIFGNKQFGWNFGWSLKNGENEQQESYGVTFCQSFNFGLLATLIRTYLKYLFPPLTTLNSNWQYHSWNSLKMNMKVLKIKPKRQSLSIKAFINSALITGILLSIMIAVIEFYKTKRTHDTRNYIFSAYYSRVWLFGIFALRTANFNLKEFRFFNQLELRNESSIIAKLLLRELRWTIAPSIYVFLQTPCL